MCKEKHALSVHTADALAHNQIFIHIQKRLWLALGKKIRHVLFQLHERSHMEAPPPPTKKTKQNNYLWLSSNDAFPPYWLPRDKQQDVLQPQGKVRQTFATLVIFCVEVLVGL